MLFTDMTPLAKTAWTAHEAMIKRLGHGSKTLEQWQRLSPTSTVSIAGTGGSLGLALAGLIDNLTLKTARLQKSLDKLARNGPG